MTKEQMLEQVDIAHKIYELLKPIPYYERYLINGMVEQFSRADQQKEQEAAKIGYLNGVSPAPDFPVPRNAAEESR